MKKKGAKLILLIMIFTLSLSFLAGVVSRAEGTDTSSANAGSAGRRVSDYNGKRVGVLAGTMNDTFVIKALPDAKLSYYNNISDMIAALEADKVDSIAGDEPVFSMAASENDRLEILDESLQDYDLGAIFPKTQKGEKLLSEFNEFIAKLKASGELDEIYMKWKTGPEEKKTLPDYSNFPAPNGMITMATEGSYPPLDYFRGTEIVGVEVDLAARFCEAYGYGLMIDAMNFDGVLASAQTGKADFGLACITISEERKESVNFSIPYYKSSAKLMILKDNAGAGSNVSPGSDNSFLRSIGESFEKTFVREERWKLFLEGVLTTLVITLLAMLFGTILGFLIFMLCRKGNPVANIITRIFLWLIQGMPAVVLLMVLYFIIFGSVQISGVAVSVIGFTLIFGAAVFGLLKMGVGTIDRGQYEAAYALGYSNTRTFFRIILPQALYHVLPAYKGEVVSLIKATAIVGYIAVQDLTKMGDIVRSRTYEAFFPLIAVTIIYFALEVLIGRIISRLSININPKRRKPSKILKGVNTNDQN